MEDELEGPSGKGPILISVLLALAAGYASGNLLPIVSNASSPPAAVVTSPNPAPAPARSTGVSDEATSASATPLDITAVANALDENSVIFDQDFKGSARQFKLPVAAVLGVMDSGYFALSMAIAGRTGDVFMLFSRLDTATQRSIRKGQMVTANCIVSDGSVIQIFLDPCTLLEVN